MVQKNLFSKPLKGYELADALGISPSMVSRLAKRGMPTDDVVKAQRWRKRHLETSRMKAPPAGLVVPPPPGLQPGRRIDPYSALTALANRLAAQNPPDLARLQLVLRDVPPGRRRFLRIPPAVWAELVGPDVLAAIADPTNARADLARVLANLADIGEDPAWMFALGHALHPTRPLLNPEPENDA